MADQENFLALAQLPTVRYYYSINYVPLDFQVSLLLTLAFILTCLRIYIVIATFEYRTGANFWRSLKSKK